MNIIRRLLSFTSLPKVRKIKSWDEVSTFLLFILAFLCSCEASFYGYVIGRFGPDYIMLPDELGAMENLRFLLVGAILLVILMQVFLWRMAAKKLTGLLENRLFPE